MLHGVEARNKVASAPRHKHDGDYDEWNCDNQDYYKTHEMCIRDRGYSAHIRFGVTTDTLDTEGNVTSASGVVPGREEIEAVLPRFRGQIEQIPPMYSAIKIGGRCV